MIHTYKNNSGTIEISKSDMEIFALTKIRADNECSMCKKSIKRGCYCLGKGYYKYCLDCSSKVLDNACNSMGEYIEAFKKLKKSLNDNKTEFLRSNLANSL